VFVGLVISENCDYCEIIRVLLKELQSLSNNLLEVKVSEMNVLLKRVLGIDRVQWF